LIDLTSIPKLQSRDRTRPKYINADKGYDSQELRKYLRLRQIKANIPEKKPPKGKIRRRKGRKPVLDKERYKNRNQIERLFGRIKHFRRIATRYDKYAQVFLAFIYLAIISLYLKKYFSNTT
jgi:transposase